MNTRRPIAAAVAVLLAAAGGASLRGGSHPPTSAAAASAAATAAPRSSGGARREARAVSTRNVYQAAFSQRLRVGDRQGAAVRISGRWSLTPLPGTSLVEARLDDARIEGEGAPQVPRDALRAPVLLEHDAAGRLRGLRFAEGTPTTAKALLTGIAAMTQLTPGAGARWSAEEEDAAGFFEASYTRAGNAVKRAIRGYTRLHGGGADRRMVVEGDASITLGPDERPATLTLRAATRFSPGEEMPAVEGEIAAALTLVDRVPVDAAELWAAEERIEGYGPAAMLLADKDAGAGRRADERRAAGAKLGDLRRAFVESGEAPESTARDRRRAKLVGQASAVLRLDPAAALDAGKKLGAAEIAADDARFLAAALGAAGTEEASAALAQALESKEASHEARLQAAAALATSSVADADTVGALEAAAAGGDPVVRSTATLALGAQARTLASAGGDLPVDPVARLVTGYADARDHDARAVILKALGNSGDPRALPVIRSALENPALEAAAVYALRFIPGEEVDALLHGFLTSHDPLARLPALAAAYYRPAAMWIPWLEAALATEKDEEAQSAIKSALAKMGAPR
ncbi:Hypothetical protein A7982_02068 [Minicystis rosea]|nr:Hypothetical protein A7982_02068 [Minicystis rosea]